LQDNASGGSPWKLLGFGPLQPWEFDAACNGTPVEIWFGTDRDSDARSKHSNRRTKFQNHVARIICKTCPVLDNCRTWVLDVNLPYGYAAMMTEAERKQERDRLGLVTAKRRDIPQQAKPDNSPRVRNGSLRNTLPTLTSRLDRLAASQGSSQQVGPKL
jgi:WhiB family redox-sensing transcriptional regulator